MMILLSGRAILAVYAALLGLGGLLGFVKARSRPSLIAGSISTLAFLGLLVWSFSAPILAFRIGAILAGLLMAMFFNRARKSGKFLPAGLIAIVSLGVLIALGVLQSQIGP